MKKEATWGAAEPRVVTTPVGSSKKALICRIKHAGSQGGGGCRCGAETASCGPSGGVGNKCAVRR